MREYLESVFSVNPHPEDMVKYKLHGLLGLEMLQINDWFHNRYPADVKFYTVPCQIWLWLTWNFLLHDRLIRVTTAIIPIFEVEPSLGANRWP